MITHFIDVDTESQRSTKTTQSHTAEQKFRPQQSGLEPECLTRMLKDFSHFPTAQLQWTND